MRLNLIVLKDIYAIYRFSKDIDTSEWINNSKFYSVTKTQDELSIVCKQLDIITEESAINKDWRVLKIQGPLDFTLVGIIAEISVLLKSSNISIFTISTFDTDYILVKNQDLNKAVDALEQNRHLVTLEN